jgi:ribosomal protein S18 acetylase RimI-like enzyme
MRIREFRYERDLEGVLDLWSTAGPGVQLSKSDQPDEIRKKIKRDPDLFIVAEEGGKLIGAVLGGYDGRRGMIYHLAISRTHRRQGVGRALMEELERRLRSKGCLKYYLLVTKDNEEALRFYRDVGCEVMEMHIMGKEIT